MIKSIVKFLENNSILGSSNSGWDGNDILRRVINTVILGLSSIFIFACGFYKNGAGQILTTGSITAGAAFLVGSFIGFLFGIPRTLQVKTEDNSIDDQNLVNDSDKLNRYINSYRPNTNLEQISDWLTKILVGVGLTQINQIRNGFSGIVEYIAPDLGSNKTFAGALILYFLLCGFMLGYLWSRLYMAKALNTADIETLSKRVVYQVQLKSDKQAEADAKALSMVNAHLNPAPGMNSIPAEELKKALIAASPVIKVTAFDQARTFRQRYWNKDNQKVERVIPIYQALIESDTERRFHRNYGQLGYALKDKVNPDWSAAEKAIGEAILIRNEKGNIDKWLLYEFNRAYCRIMINKSSPVPIFGTNSIVEDIKKAVKSAEIKRIVTGDLTILKWLQESGISIDDITE